MSADSCARLSYISTLPDRHRIGAGQQPQRKHGRWLNQAEIEISLFGRQCLGKRRIANLRELKREARAWNRKMNKNKTLIHWTFTRNDARKKFGYASKLFTRSET